MKLNTAFNVFTSGIHDADGRKVGTAALAEVCRRANLHDEMVAALRAAREQVGRGPQLPASHLFDTAVLIDSVLAKVEAR